jgi:hypothetical protein
METLIRTKKVLGNKSPRLTSNINTNKRWANNWLEQIYEVGNKTEASSLANNNMDDFCFYLDATQAN